MNSESRYDLLLQHCADLEVDVEYSNLGRRHGEYHHPDLILLNPSCTMAQLISALAHELGHWLYSENGITANCTRADEAGASLVLSVAEYAAAEEEVGEHPGAIAKHLDLTRRLILGWQRWYLRSHAPMARESDDLV